MLCYLCYTVKVSITFIIIIIIIIITIIIIIIVLLRLVLCDWEWAIRKLTNTLNYSNVVYMPWFLPMRTAIYWLYLTFQTQLNILSTIQDIYILRGTAISIQ